MVKYDQVQQNVIKILILNWV